MYGEGFSFCFESLRHSARFVVILGTAKWSQPTPVTRLTAPATASAPPAHPNQTFY